MDIKQQYQQFLKQRRSQAAEYFAAKGHAVLPEQPHVLADPNDWRLNIIDQGVHPYIEAESAKRRAQGKGFARHGAVHSGVSSQALLFNLVGPLVVRKEYRAFDAILHAAGFLVGGDVSRAEFEYEEPSIFHEYGGGQPTSVDLALWTDSGDAVLIESKFTESGFGECSSKGRGGTCSGDNPLPDFSANCYVSKQGRTCWEVFQRHHLPGVFDLEVPECPIAGQYQLYRLVGFALKKGAHFVLLYDGRNPTFVGPGGCYSGFLDDLKPAAKAKCHALTIQRAVQALERHQGAERVLEFRKKYL